MDNFITMLNLQSRLHTQQGAIALGELFKSASDEILSLREENEALTQWITAISNGHQQVPNWIKQSAKSLLVNQAAKGGE